MRHSPTPRRPVTSPSSARSSGEAPSTVTWGNMLVITKRCRNVDAAWRYLKYVTGLEGNLLRHIAVMSVTSSVGLMAVFAVDFIDMISPDGWGEVLTDWLVVGDASLQDPGDGLVADVTLDADRNLLRIKETAWQLAPTAESDRSEWLLGALFGALLDASHESLRRDFEVSSVAWDGGDYAVVVGDAARRTIFDHAETRNDKALAGMDQTGPQTVGLLDRPEQGAGSGNNSIGVVA